MQPSVTAFNTVVTALRCCENEAVQLVVDTDVFIFAECTFEMGVVQRRPEVDVLCR